MKKVLGNKWYIFLLSAPALILLAAFVVYPIFNIVVMSLQKTNGLTPPEWIGLENFKTLLQDEAFIRANLASLGLCLLAVLCNAVLAVIVSILLDRKSVV